MSAFPADPVAWPFSVNWADPYRVTYSFKTSIIVSRAGFEQRRALRSKPRKSIEFSSLYAGTGLNTLRRLLARRQPLPFVIPETARRVWIVGGVGNNGSIALAAVPPWMQPGTNVVVTAGERVEIGVVSAIGGATIVVQGLGSGWVQGGSVAPALACYVNQVGPSLPTNGVATATLRFDVIPGSESTVEPAPPVDSYDGRPLWIRRPNWAQPASETFLWPSETVDYDRGRMAVFHPVGFGTMTRQATFLMPSVADAESLVAFYAAQRGRRGEFYAPYWGDDLILTSVTLAAGSDITVAGTDVQAAFDGELVHRALVIKLNDGTVLRRRVSAIGTSGPNSVLTLDAPLGVTISPASVDQISWLPIWRFGSDDLVIEWATGTVAQATVAMTTLPNTEYLDGVLRAVPQGDIRTIAGSGDDRGVA